MSFLAAVYRGLQRRPLWRRLVFLLCTADQKLERCVVAKNRTQEVRESPR